MQRFIGVVGIAVILAIAYLLSTDRRAIKPRVILWGLGLQLGLAVIILKTAFGEQAFMTLGNAVNTLLDYTKVGSGFVFGSLLDIKASGFIFAFQVLPVIVFFGSLMAIAYHLGVMQRVVAAIAKVMVKTMGTSGAESLSATACIFVGQSEAPLLIRPYLAEMTRSELMAVMTGGMATIAGSVLAAYIGMLGKDYAPHLLAASIMGAPAGLVMAKMLLPETEHSKTAGKIELSVEKTESSVIEAAAKGAFDGMHLAFNVGAMLLAFIALIALVNGVLGFISFGWNQGFHTHLPALSLEMILGWLFAPLAFLMGVPWGDVLHVGSLLGQKIVLNEFVAYSQLSTLLHDPHAAYQLSPKAALIATYALCGFANFSSIAINIGCIGGLAPERRGDLAKLGLRAMTGGALASCMTATLAGILS